MGAVSTGARTAAAIALVVTLGACSTLLGFEDALDGPVDAIEPETPLDGSVARSDVFGSGGAAAEDASSGTVASETTTDAGSGGTSLAAPCTCHARAPSGWTGPYAAAPDACPEAFPIDAFRGTKDPSAAPAVCTCACGAPQNVECSASVASWFLDGNCRTSCAEPRDLEPNRCTAYDRTSCKGGAHVSFGPSSARGGSCVPSATKSLPSVTGTSMHLCARSTEPSRGTCAADEICASPSLARTCIARSGTYDCPATYPARSTYFDAANDTRDCTSCSCGPPSGTSCNLEITGYSEQSCRGDVTTTQPVPGACVSADRSIRFASTPSGGSCTPRGGTAVGAYQPTNPTTVCCQN